MWNNEIFDRCATPYPFLSELLRVLPECRDYILSDKITSPIFAPILLLFLIMYHLVRIGQGLTCYAAVSFFSDSAVDFVGIADLSVALCFDAVCFLTTGFTGALPSLYFLITEESFFLLMKY